MTELLQQVRIIDPVSETDQIADVLIVDGYISCVAETISDVSADTQIRDCRGLILGSGLVDLYSHSGEPGFEERETISSLLQAAAAGGFTRISILPDTSPPIDNPSVVAQLLQRRGQGGRGTGGLLGRISPHSPHPPLLPPSPPPLPPLWGAITPGGAGRQMTEL
ncbi:dihydroorotase, partial [Plectonema radiosum NIES-515]|nr:dihydroorotase [Plectonema radiosum NIES-515]